MNDLFDVLSHERRRTLLAILTEVEPPVDVRALARRLSEDEAPGGDPSSAAVDRVHISLRHVHLPRLAASHLVEFDPDRDAVVGVSDEAESLVSDDPL